MTVDISTHPSFTFPAGKVAKYPGVEEFSPCMIYPIIKPTLEVGTADRGEQRFHQKELLKA